MSTIQEMIDRLSKLKINDLLDDSVMETKEVILNHVRTQMLFGNASDGSLLGRYKWESYAIDKAKYFGSYHAPFGIYNYEKDGSFHDLMYLRPTLTSYEISSTDKKTDYLEQLAGQAVGSGQKVGGQRTFGISKENLIDYCDNNLKPELQNRLRTLIHG